MSDAEEDKSGVYFEIEDSGNGCGVFEIISRVSADRPCRSVGSISSREVREGENKRIIFVSHEYDIARYLRDSANMIEEEKNPVQSIDHTKELMLLREIKELRDERDKFRNICVGVGARLQ